MLIYIRKIISVKRKTLGKSIRNMRAVKFFLRMTFIKRLFKKSTMDISKYYLKNIIEKKINKSIRSQKIRKQVVTFSLNYWNFVLYYENCI